MVCKKFTKKMKGAISKGSQPNSNLKGFELWAIVIYR